MDFDNILRGKVVIVGIGNIMRGDDAFGPVFIQNITGKVDALCIDAGSAPENYAGKIAKQSPDTILLVDAVHMGIEPGGYKVLDKGEISETGFSTHDASPNMFIRFLENETDADIYLLAVQPKDVSFGSDMSMAVDKALNILVKKIQRR
jgi:hydrogenase 3 maturation protease